METSVAPRQPEPRILRRVPAREGVVTSRTFVLALAPHSRSIPAVPSAWAVSKGRRWLDLAAALFALALLWPLLGLIALLVRLSSPGPVIFRQQRVGRNKELFTVYKFRTMETGAGSGPSHTKSGDCRVTRVGAFLRRYKLDELPQLFNVLRGEMSLVGPRPKLPHHETRALPVRPGLTGAATLVFRCEEEILEHIPDHELDAFYTRTIKPLKTSLDWEYMRKASLASDLTLLWHTAGACVFRRAGTWAIDLLREPVRVNGAVRPN